jgi:two-component system, cell cycle response regulator
VSERLRTAICSAPFVLADGVTITVAVSVGHALADANKELIESAMNRADAALYAAKREGKNRVVGDAARDEPNSIEAFAADRGTK